MQGNRKRLLFVGLIAVVASATAFAASGTWTMDEPAENEHFAFGTTCVGGLGKGPLPPTGYVFRIRKWASCQLYGSVSGTTFGEEVGEWQATVHARLLSQ